jgi:uncharacterized protein (DUF1015 family)
VFVLPMHRLVRGLTEFNPQEVLAKLSRYFSLEPVETGALDNFGGAISLLWLGRSHGLWRVCPREDRAHEALMPSDKSDAWRSLDLAVLSSAILEGVLGIRPETALDHVSYTSSALQAMRDVDNGKVQMAFLVEPSTVQDLMTIADAGDRMPPKSTFFWPKVPAGLVIHDLC